MYYFSGICYEADTSGGSNGEGIEVVITGGNEACSGQSEVAEQGELNNCETFATSWCMVCNPILPLETKVSGRLEVHIRRM